MRFTLPTIHEAENDELDRIRVDLEILEANARHKIIDEAQILNLLHVVELGYYRTRRAAHGGSHVLIAVPPDLQAAVKAALCRALAVPGPFRSPSQVYSSDGRTLRCALPL